MKRLVYAAISLIVFGACSKEPEIAQITKQTNGSESVLATAKDFAVAWYTKTAITQSGSNAPTFAWKAGDVIGIIPMNGKTVQSNYEIAEIGSNPKNATFDGGVWALKEGNGYAAYYPYQYEAIPSNGSLTFSFLGQTQSANNSLEHLGAYDYMYASSVVPQSGCVLFDFEHKISLMRLQLTVPQTDTFTDAVLESSESWFAAGASLKLSDGTMTATETVKSATINLNNITVAAGNNLTIWFAMLPTSALSGRTLSVKLIGNNNTFTGEITGLTTLTAGSAYSYASSLVPAGPVVEYVDLGLSVKWATCNLGANSPEEYGDYYAWGETETKSYTIDAYKYAMVQHFDASEDQYDNDGFLIKEGAEAHDEYRYNKYVPESKTEQYGFESFYDDKTILELEDDVAHVKLGGKWRIPTYAEWMELRDNCQWQWANYKGVDGYKFTSNISGYTEKWIFLPAAGAGIFNSVGARGTQGYYWSSSLQTDYPDKAYCLYMYSAYVNKNSNQLRYYGLSIRPVSE